jgi:hypothetical protein
MINTPTQRKANAEYYQIRTGLKAVKMATKKATKKAANKAPNQNHPAGAQVVHLPSRDNASSASTSSKRGKKVRMDLVLSCDAKAARDEFEDGNYDARDEYQEYCQEYCQEYWEEEFWEEY